MSLISTLKAGALAVALGSTAFVAAPAMAAPPPPAPNFSFSFNVGPNGFGPSHDGPGMHFNYNNNPKYMCLSDRQIYRQLQRQGFRSIQIVKSRGYRAIVVARWHGDWYQLLVDRCSGRIQRAPLHWKGNGMPGPGIHFQFSL